MSEIHLLFYFIFWFLFCIAVFNNLLILHISWNFIVIKQIICIYLGAKKSWAWLRHVNRIMKFCYMHACVREAVQTYVTTHKLDTRTHVRPQWNVMSGRKKTKKCGRIMESFSSLNSYPCSNSGSSLISLQNHTRTLCLDQPPLFIILALRNFNSHLNQIRKRNRQTVANC